MRVYDTQHSPRDKAERAIYNALRTYPNQIAGRPNAGNLALPYIHRGQMLPEPVLEGYALRVLQTFIPGAVFTVEALPEADADGFQRLRVGYEVP